MYFGESAILEFNKPYYDIIEDAGKAKFAIILAVSINKATKENLSKESKNIIFKYISKIYNGIKNNVLNYYNKDRKGKVSKEDFDNYFTCDSVGIKEYKDKNIISIVINSGWRSKDFELKEKLKNKEIILNDDYSHMFTFEIIIKNEKSLKIDYSIDG